MQDKDFDRFIQQAFENQPEPEYNPADWDMLEDRLHNLNAAQPNAAGTSAGAGLGKLGFVASAILVTALNVVLLTKPEFVKNAISPEQKSQVAATVEQNEIPAVDNAAISQLPAGELIADAEEAATIQQDKSEAGLTINNMPEMAEAAEQVAVIKPATQTSVAKPAVRNTSKASQGTTTTWAWPAVAANRPGSHMASQGLSAGQPVATVQPCNPTFNPEIATVLVGKDTLNGSRISLSSCQMLEARFFTKGEPAEKISLTSNVAKVLPGASLETEAGSNSVLLQWQPSPEMARQQPYVFTVWVADERCAQAAPKAYQFAVQVSPAFTAAFNGVTRINKGQETTLEVKGAPVGSTYQWVTGNKIVAENESGRLVAAPVRSTTYRIVVTAPTGCVFTDSLRVEVAPGELLAAAKSIPNIFTPNNDGVNDFFEVQLPEEGPYNLEVYDRDGKLVYAQNKYDNKWNAPKLASGTYYYIITTPRENKSYKGWVEILR